MLSSIVSIGSKVIDRVIPDPQAASEAKLRLLELEQEGQLREFEAVASVDKAQAAVNAAEAKSLSLFRAGWRPSVGWVCSLGLAYQFVLRPLLSWAALMYGVPVPPELDLTDLLPLLIGMLGLGAYRTFEKRSGCDKT